MEVTILTACPSKATSFKSDRERRSQKPRSQKIWKGQETYTASEIPNVEVELAGYC